MIIKTTRFFSPIEKWEVILEVRKQPNGRYALEAFGESGHPLGPNLLHSVKDLRKTDALAGMKRWRSAWPYI